MVRRSLLMPAQFKRGRHTACNFFAMELVVGSGKSVQTRTMRAAAKVAGSPTKLRHRLGVRSSDLMDWLSGVQQPPREVFLRAVELVLDDLEGRSPDGAGILAPGNALGDDIDRG